MKSYAASRNKPIIDWKKTFRELQSINVISAQTKRINDELLKDWCTCPCGQLPSSISREEDGTPHDEILKYLGLEVYHAVENDNYDSAMSIVDCINARGKYLAKAAVTTTLNRIKELQSEIKKLEELLP